MPQKCPRKTENDELSLIDLFTESLCIQAKLETEEYILHLSGRLCNIH